jgi:phosphate starvation-inducible PhoH-like protein
MKRLVCLEPFLSHYTKMKGSLFFILSLFISSRAFVPMTANQRLYMKGLHNTSIPVIISAGASGTGKTFLACKQAVSQLLDQSVDRVVLTRPTIAVDDEEFGFLPGGVFTKMDPFMQPIYDVLRETLDVSTFSKFIKTRKIEVCPLAFMRGRTFKNTFIVADEMQNAYKTQTKMLLTRLGENSRLVLTGDLQQSDIGGLNNGFLDLVERCKIANDPLIQLFELDEPDIIRSPACRAAIRLYDIDRRTAHPPLGAVG